MTIQLQLISSASLALSGLLITLVSAFFSVHGFLLFLPASDLHLGILGLGIAFEVAKIVGCTFLFHSMKDRAFPWFFKGIMLTSMLALILFSSIFSFVHLNSSASASLSTSQTNAVRIAQLDARNTAISGILKGFDDQISNVPSNMNTARMRLYDKFKEERSALQTELAGNSAEIVRLQTSNTESDQFKFLTSFSQLAGVDKATVFTVVILFIVVIIDPLAISLFLSASYIFVGRKQKSVILQEDVAATPPVSPKEATPEVKETLSVPTTELNLDNTPDNLPPTVTSYEPIFRYTVEDTKVEEPTTTTAETSKLPLETVSFDTFELEQYFRHTPPELPLEEVSEPEPEGIVLPMKETLPVEKFVEEPTVPLAAGATYASIEPVFDDTADSEIEKQISSPPIIDDAIRVEDIDTNGDGDIIEAELHAAEDRLPPYVRVLKLQASKQ